MKIDKLEELILSASESDTDEIRSELLGVLSNCQNLKSADVAELVQLLFESWSNGIADSDGRRAFTLAILELDPPDSAVFRDALTQSIKSELPRRFSQRGVLNLLGLRDAATPLLTILKRFQGLRGLNEGVYLYQPNSHVWGEVKDIDEFAATMLVSPLKGKNSYSVPLEAAINDLHLFAPNSDLLSMLKLNKKNPPSATDWKKVLLESAISPLDAAVLKEIAMHLFVPECFPFNKFDQWWCAAIIAENSNSSPKLRSPSEARSLEELLQILSRCVQSPEESIESEVLGKKFETLVVKYSKRPTSKQKRQMAECLALLAEVIPKEELAQSLSPVLTYFDFIPRKMSLAEIDSLEVWGDLPSSIVAKLVSCLRTMLGDDIFSSAALVLPQKVLNLFLADLTVSELAERIEASGFVSADLLLWIWKNRASKSAELIKLLTIKRVVAALAPVELPKAWQSSQRELKALLLDKNVFQEMLMNNAVRDVQAVIGVLRAAKFLAVSEQQSLLVKLSRHSKEFRQALEGGVARKMFAKSTAEQESAREAQTPLVTSIPSYNRRLEELEDIINKQMPENTVAIAHARSYGDLRENAEYSAAKERQSFLINRRAELEADILSAQPTDFKDVEINGIVQIGSTVEIEFSDGKIKTMYLVGAWDGVPEKSLVSYKTPMGQELLYKELGNEIKLPGGEIAKISAIKPLPVDLMKRFAYQ